LARSAVLRSKGFTIAIPLLDLSARKGGRPVRRLEADAAFELHEFQWR
jgi:hypothetical protein